MKETPCDTCHRTLGEESCSICRHNPTFMDLRIASWKKSVWVDGDTSLVDYSIVNPNGKSLQLIRCHNVGGGAISLLDKALHIKTSATSAKV